MCTPVRMNGYGFLAGPNREMDLEQGLVGALRYLVVERLDVYAQEVAGARRRSRQALHADICAFRKCSKLCQDK